MIRTVTLAAVVLLAPMAVHAQTGETQSRDGLGSGSGSQSKLPSNSAPAGALNATTGPQSQPAYSSGLSTTPNPGAAFVGLTPKPAEGQVQAPPGTLSTTTVGAGGTTTTNGGPGVNEATAPPK